MKNIERDVAKTRRRHNHQSEVMIFTNITRKNKIMKSIFGKGTRTIKSVTSITPITPRPMSALWTMPPTLL